MKGLSVGIQSIQFGALITSDSSGTLNTDFWDSELMPVFHYNFFFFFGVIIKVFNRFCGSALKFYISNAI